jgi:hypothetical protein
MKLFLVCCSIQCKRYTPAPLACLMSDHELASHVRVCPSSAALRKTYRKFSLSVSDRYQCGCDISPPGSISSPSAVYLTAANVVAVVLLFWQVLPERYEHLVPFLQRASTPLSTRALHSIQRMSNYESCVIAIARVILSPKGTAQQQQQTPRASARARRTGRPNARTLQTPGHA